MKLVTALKGNVGHKHEEPSRCTQWYKSKHGAQRLGQDLWQTVSDASAQPPCDI